MRCRKLQNKDGDSPAEPKSFSPKFYWRCGGIAACPFGTGNAVANGDQEVEESEAEEALTRLCRLWKFQIKTSVWPGGRRG